MWRPAPSTVQLDHEPNSQCDRSRARERTFALLTEVLVQVEQDLVPNTVKILPDLRGPPGPAGPGGKLPIAKEWQREKVYYESEVVIHDGATYQALHDTGEAPDNAAHWMCLAAPGRDGKSIRHGGTFKEDAEYSAHDAVALNGGSFLALHDKPGACPGGLAPVSTGQSSPAQNSPSPSNPAQNTPPAGAPATNR